MEKRKKYRLSGPAVVIGWLFLIPSFLGMAFGVLGLFAAGGASSSAADRVQREYERDLRKANISDEQVAKRLRGEQLLPSETAVLTTTQRRQLDLAEMGHGAAIVGTAAGVGIAGGASIFVLVMSFCGGLLGWILTMKKRVLQCTSCEAVVAAS